MAKATSRVAALELRGFRSVQMLAKIDFANANLTGIVGPNGSGKSTLLLALCFCFGSPLSCLGVKTLAELRCTDASQTCEVTTWMEDAQGKKKATHSISASLKPDGSREHKIDGKIRSSKEVKAFLRCRGIDLDGCSIVRQAQVTHIADTNNSQALLQVVEAASGYSRWHDETTAAQRELSGTRTALSSISSNVSKLEEAIACNAGKLAALRKIASLDRQICETQGTMGQLLAACDERCADDLQALAAELSLLEDRLGQESEDAQHSSTLLAEERARPAAAGDPGKMKAQQDMAAAEEEVRMLEERLQQIRQVREEIEVVKADIRRLTAQAASGAKLAEQQVLHISELERVASSADATSTAVDVSAEVANQRANVAREEERVKVCTAELEEASKATADSAASAQRLQKREHELQEKATRASAALPGIEASLAEAHAQTAAIAQKAEGLRQRRQRLQVSLGMLAGRTAPPCNRMLHECFGIRFPETFNKDLLRVLNVILGNKTRIAIVQTTQEASALLAWRKSSQPSADSPLRIWPADSLRHKDISAIQSQAVAAFAEGLVIKPLDLLTFDKAHQRVMEHAFGRMLIAGDAETAARLATRYGLASVTLDGRISRPGSLQGGWQGAAPRTQTAAAVLELSLIQAQQEAVAKELHGIEGRMRALQEQQRQLQADLDTHAALKLSAEQAEQDTQTGASQAQNAKQALAAAQANLEHCRSSLRHLEQLQEMFLEGDKDAGDTAKQLTELRAKLEDQQGLTDSHQAQSSAGMQLEEKVSHLLALQEELSMMDSSSLDTSLRKGRDTLQQSLNRMQALQAEAAAQEEKQMQRRKRLRTLEASSRQAQEACERTQEAIQAAKEAAAQKGEQRAHLQAELRQLEGSSGSIPGHARPQASGDFDETHALYKKQKAKLKSLQAERRRCSSSRISEAEQMLHMERVRKLSAFKEQAECMRQAVELVEQGMAAMTLQVERTKKAVFNSMAEQFAGLSAGLIPAVELRLAWVGEGVQFQWRHQSGGGDSWQNDLAQLSGGQRSLVAITLLVAAAKAGSRSRLYLLDEVDAALDESNQAVVASLMHQLCSQQSGCQCFAVTHSVAFQGCCDALVQVSCEEQGTVFSAVTGAGKDRKRARM